MNLDKLESLFEVLNQLLEVEGGADETTVAPMLQQMYGELVGKYRPILRALPSVAGVATKDLVPVVKTFLTVANDVRADEDIQAMVAEGGVLKAKMRKTALDAYMDAGFGREEAMALVLQDVANAKAHLHHAGSNSASSTSKNH